MDDRTGKIVDESEVAKMIAGDRKHYVPLTGAQYQAAQGMNRKERRALARKIRREQRKEAPRGK